VRSCQRRGVAIDLVLDRPRENRSQLVFTRIQGGREGIFWQYARTTRQARPGIRVPRRRASDLAHLTILIDTRERYPYKFTHQQAATERQALPAGNYGIAHDGEIVAVVERKSLHDLVRRLIDGQLTYALADMATIPRAAVVVEDRATPACSSSRTPSPRSSPSCSPRSPSATRPCRSTSPRPGRSPRSGPTGSSAPRSPTPRPKRLRCKADLERVMPVFVLIHSPLVGPTTWSAVARELERRGRQAVVPSLLGVAEAPAPQWRHVPEAVHDARSQVADPVVLIGHSGAGLLLPVIADTLSCEVIGLIFVDAFLPPASGDVRLLPSELVGPPAPTRQRPSVAAVVAMVRRGHDARARADAALRWSLEREMPRLPLSYFDASVPTPDGWAKRPCGYLLLSPDTYGESATRARNLGWPVADLPDAHHLTIVTDPVAVTDALLALETALAVAE
jgi:hypothetical protein